VGVGQRHSIPRTPRPRLFGAQSGRQTPTIFLPRDNHPAIEEKQHLLPKPPTDGVRIPQTELKNWPAECVNRPMAEQDLIHSSIGQFPLLHWVAASQSAPPRFSGLSGKTSLALPSPITALKWLFTARSNSSSHMTGEPHPYIGSSIRWRSLRGLKNGSRTEGVEFEAQRIRLLDSRRR
jgi:hypothetical protein